MAPRALLLDLDGTLWDSAPWYAEQLSRDADEQVRLAKLLSQPSDSASVAGMLKSAGLTPSRIRIAAFSVGPPALFPDAVDFLRAYKSTGGLIAIVTNLPAWLVAPLIDAEELDVIDHLETARRGVPGKPKPHLVRRALDALATDPADAHMIGDTIADQQAAAAANVAFTWADWGYGGSAPPGVVVARSWREVSL